MNDEFLGTWPTVQWFGNEMQRKLLKNSHKGDTWERCSDAQLLKRLKQEVMELEKAISIKSGVIGEAADVANFAMFIASNFDERGKS